MKSIESKMPEMAQIDLSKSELPKWYPDPEWLIQKMWEYIHIPDYRFNIDFKEIK